MTTKKAATKKIGFKKLEDKVAKQYAGKAVPKKYQKEYGKRYSKKEAKVVGAKVAAKVKRQKDNKMAKGGKIASDKHKYYIKAYNTETDYKNKNANLTDANSVLWEIAKGHQDRLIETGDYYAVQILAKKDNREVSVVFNSDTKYAKGGKINRPKFKVGDMVYSWQNPDYKAEVAFVNPREIDGKTEYHYKVTLKDKDGYTKSSKWMHESGMSKTKKGTGTYSDYAEGGQIPFTIKRSSLPDNVFVALRSINARLVDGDLHVTPINEDVYEIKAGGFETEVSSMEVGDGKTVYDYLSTHKYAKGGNVEKDFVIEFDDQTALLSEFLADNMHEGESQLSDDEIVALKHLKPGHKTNISVHAGWLTVMRPGDIPYNEWMGGTSCNGGCYTGVSGLAKIKEISKKYSKNLYLVTDDNYNNIGNYWLRDGVFAKVDAIGNPEYDFQNHKVSLKGKAGVIYKFKRINKEDHYAEGGNVDPMISDIAQAAIKGDTNGEEVIINEKLHYGVGDHPYAFIDDLKKAGVPYTEGKNSLFGHLMTKEDVIDFLKYIQSTDGYIDISQDENEYGQGGTAPLMDKEDGAASRKMLLLHVKDISHGKVPEYVNKMSNDELQQYLHDRGYGVYAEGGEIDIAEDRIANSEAHVYTENRIPFQGKNLEGKLLDNGDYLVLSLHCFPIWFYCAAEGKWYQNKDMLIMVNSFHLSQARPTWNAEIIPDNEMDQKIIQGIGKYDLGGLAVRQLYPMTTDNTLIAHDGAANTEM